MRTNPISAPASLVLAPVAYPCALELAGEVVKWREVGEPRRLKGGESEAAMERLGETLILTGFSLLSKDSLGSMLSREQLDRALEEKATLGVLRAFAADYGYLLPRKEIPLQELRATCLHLVYAIKLHVLARWGDSVAAALFEDLLPKQCKAPYLKLIISEDYRPMWQPVHRRSGLCFVRPETFKSREEILAYAEREIGRYLAECLSKWPVKYKVRKNILEVHLNHLLPCYLAAQLAFGLRSCACGCGRMVSQGKKYFEKSCYRKLLNAKPHRKIASWLRTMKHRGKLGEAEYRRLVGKAKEMLEEGYTEGEVRAEIETLLAGEADLPGEENFLR